MRIKNKNGSYITCPQCGGDIRVSKEFEKSEWVKIFNIFVDIGEYEEDDYDLKGKVITCECGKAEESISRLYEIYKIREGVSKISKELLCPFCNGEVLYVISGWYKDCYRIIEDEDGAEVEWYLEDSSERYNDKGYPKLFCKCGRCQEYYEIVQGTWKVKIKEKGE